MLLTADILLVCPVCGPVTDSWTIDGSRFCAQCLAKFLRYGGVSQVVMKRVDHEKAQAGPSDRVEVHVCPKCWQDEDAMKEVEPTEIPPAGTRRT